MIASVAKSSAAGIILLALIMSVELVGSASSAIGLFISVLLVYGACIVLGIVTVGVPVHLALKRFNQQSATTYGLVGVVPPVLISVLFRPFGEDGTLGILIQASVAGTIGFVCAYTFWRSEVSGKNA